MPSLCAGKRHRSEATIKCRLCASCAVLQHVARIQCAVHGSCEHMYASCAQTLQTFMFCARWHVRRVDFTLLHSFVHIGEDLDLDTPDNL